MGVATGLYLSAGCIGNILDKADPAGRDGARSCKQTSWLAALFCINSGYSIGYVRHSHGPSA